MHECLERPDLERLQLERLRQTLDRASHVPCYRAKFEEAGVDSQSVVSLTGLSKLPFTTKDDLRQNYPYGMFAVPMREVVRIHSSSGTTGKPTVVGYSRQDLNTWSELVARFMVAAGVTA
ncbi:MAG: phenylacetate--CoA ligase, partial [Desulfuromonas sp.]